LAMSHLRRGIDHHPFLCSNPDAAVMIPVLNIGPPLAGMEIESKSGNWISRNAMIF
jgi:hypothetical protein